MIFDQGVLMTYLGRGIFLPMGASISAGAAANGNTSITIYSGTQPNSNVIIDDWASYNTSYLAHKSNVIVYYANNNTKEASKFLTLRTTLTPQTAINTGNAEWCIIWIGNQTETNITNSTITSNSFIIAPVSNTFGNGVVKLDTIEIASGNTINITDLTLRLTFA